MAEDNRDILMKIEITPGKYVSAECSAQVALDDPMALEFVGTGTAASMAAADALGTPSFSRYFGVDDFSFEFGISDQGGDMKKTAPPTDIGNTAQKIMDVADKRVQEVHAKVSEALEDQNAKLQEQMRSLLDWAKQVSARTEERARLQAQKALPPPAYRDISSKLANLTARASTNITTSNSASGRGTFRSFMEGGRQYLKSHPNAYPSDLQEVTVTKVMDASSTTLFELLKKSTKLKSATILKRKATGGEFLGIGSGGLVGMNYLYGFLRVDFYDLMLTALDWDDEDDSVTEKFKFVCRKMMVTYAMEVPTPGLTAQLLVPQMPVVWNAVPTAT